MPHKDLKAAIQRVIAEMKEKLLKLYSMEPRQITRAYYALPYIPIAGAINEIGDEYKERIYREYLGIEPPPGTFLTRLR